MTVDKGIYIQNIYYMLSYAFQILKQEDYQHIASEKFDKIHDLFAAILEKGVSRQLKQGLYREYVPLQDNLSVMRGKLNMNATIQQKIQKKQKLSCEFDEFSEDNLYNQILKVTIHRLIHAEDVASERKQALKKLILFFGNVRLIQTDHIAWQRLIYQRNNRNYELLLNICYLVLNGMLQTTEDGSYKLLAFSDEHMERLYERFVLKYYEQHHHELNPAAPTIDWDYSKESDSPLIQYLPKMKTDIVLTKDNKTLIIDAKSGTSGAGRGAKLPNLYCEVNESIKAYGVTSHRHTPEIEEQLGYACGKEIMINFTPHLVPMNRGILVTEYATLNKKDGKLPTKEEVMKAYHDMYDDEFFVRVLEYGECPETKWVEGSNFVDVSCKIDERTGRIVMMGALDNLVKGAAGQAVQNMNILFGLDEKTGLDFAPMFP